LREKSGSFILPWRGGGYQEGRESSMGTVYTGQRKRIDTTKKT